MKKNVLLLLFMVATLSMANAQTDPLVQYAFNGTLDNTGTASAAIDYRLNDWTEVDPSLDSADYREGIASINFDGSGFLYGGDPAYLQNLTEFTTTFWMKLDGATAAENQGIFEKGNYIRIAAMAGNLDFVLATDQKAWYSTVLTVGPVPTDLWVHVALYYDGSKLGVRVNGGEISLTTEEGSMVGTVLTDANALMMGTGAGNYKGKLDDLRFYDVALDSAAIKALYDSYSYDNEAPAAPANLAASNIGEVSVDLAWDASTDNVGVEAYYVLQDKVRIDTVTDATSVTVTGLVPETTYEFGVIAADLAGNVSDTAKLDVTTITSADTEAPTAPASLAASNIARRSVDLTWGASTDNVGVVSYDVFKDDAAILNVTSGTSATISDLSSGTQYVFTVKANDIAGNVSDASNAVTVTTEAAPEPILAAHWLYEYNDDDVSVLNEVDVENVTSDYDMIISTTEPDVIPSLAASLDFVDFKQGISSGIFDGKIYYTCPTEQVLPQALDEFTISLWFKNTLLPLAEENSYQSLIGEESEYRVIIGADASIGFPVATENNSWYGAGSNIGTAPDAYTLNEWTYVTAVYDGAKTYLYVNGQLAAENSESITGKTLENGNGLCMGGQPGISQFRGQLDDVKFFSNGLEAEQVAKLYYEATAIFDRGANSSKISLYPNPASEMVYMEDLTAGSKVRFFSLDGRVVHETIVEGAQLTVDVSSFSKGLYLVAVENDQNRSVTKLVISR